MILSHSKSEDCSSRAGSLSLCIILAREGLSCLHVLFSLLCPGMRQRKRRQQEIASSLESIKPSKEYDTKLGHFF